MTLRLCAMFTTLLKRINFRFSSSPNEKMAKYCFARYCVSNTTTHPDKLFFRLPFIQSLRDKWCVAAGRAPNGIKQTSTVYCCSDHFDVRRLHCFFTLAMFCWGVWIGKERLFFKYFFAVGERHSAGHQSIERHGAAIIEPSKGKEPTEKNICERQNENVRLILM